MPIIPMTDRSALIAKLANCFADFENRMFHEEDSKKGASSRNAERAGDVRWAARSFGEAPAIVRNEDVVEAMPDVVGRLLTGLRQRPEFQTFEGHRIEIRWTKSVLTRRDGLLVETVAGRSGVVPVGDRLAWSHNEPPPSFRFTLSLPWFVLASEDQRERALHELLCGCGVSSNGAPIRRQPDIVAHAATLGRYGVRSPREAVAVAHVIAHPSTLRVVRQFGFDPETRQGLLWDALEPHQQNLVDHANAAGQALATAAKRFDRKRAASGDEA